MPEVQKDSQPEIECCNCRKPFVRLRVNQRTCSAACKWERKRLSQEKYKRTEKGIASLKTWAKSERNKANNYRYRQSPKAKSLAVKRAARYVKSSESRMIGKRERDRKYAASEKGRRAALSAAARYRQTDGGRLVRRASKILRRSIHGDRMDIAAWNKKVEELACRCQLCGVKFERGDLTIDHIVPVSKGGTNHIDNLQPACVSCNCSKGNRT